MSLVLSPVFVCSLHTYVHLLPVLLTSDMYIFATCTHYNVCMLFLYNFTYVRVFCYVFKYSLLQHLCVAYVCHLCVRCLSVAIGKQLVSIQPTVH